MAIEAPISKFKKNGLIIYIVICLGLTVWCVYDAHFNEEFKAKYTDADGNPTGWLLVNLKAPPYLIGAALLLGAYLLILRTKKLVADEDELVFSDKDKIRYDSIQEIDKTHFDSKGYFVLTYKNENDKAIERKISNRKYDNLTAVLEHLVAKIT